MARTRSKGITSSPAASKVKSTTTSPKKTKSTKAKKVEKKVVVDEQPVEEVEEQVDQTQSETIIPSEVSTKAISELIKYVAREKESKQPNKQSLFDDEDTSEDKLYVTINSKKYLSDKPQFKPILIKLNNSIYNQSELKTCLIIRDQLVTTNEQLESLESENLSTIEQILPLTTLKNEYKNFEKRRDLYSSYDLFLVDDALLNLMPTLLGKIFYTGNKIPVPIRITSTGGKAKELSLVTLKNQINKVLESTVYLPPMGSNVSIVIGSIKSHTQEQLVDNLNKVVDSFNIKTVKNIMLKTTNSPALPLYYTDSLFDEENDVEKKVNKKVEEEEEEEEVKLSAFEKGLLELGDVDSVSKIIGKKLGEKNKKKRKVVKGKVSKK
ncbi:CIC1 [[Candida] subhashii]|uniref:CIC1 n=1 Tax=[Candida] subhashii TaxID=561895 RepID=A0A8J5QQU4_9ASCO|nr:CIC1 [[Candida] subhashii]KAG7665664.1 CIC1 [[Candida] subhashii]